LNKKKKRRILKRRKKGGKMRIRGKKGEKCL
jgi:hypothetical protein